MARITHEESDAINNAVTKHYDTQEDFETKHGLSHAQDLGGLVVYLDDMQVVAFYDYENKWGALVG